MRDKGTGVGMKFKPKSDRMVMMTSHYIKMPHMKATLVAVQALIEDGACFQVRASGPTGSITIHDTRSWGIVQQIDTYYRNRWYQRVYQWVCDLVANPGKLIPSFA
jgi:hypothetical protein